LGRWKLTIPSGRPEGITIDPSNVDTIWIADRSTDQVHQYTGGTNWTSGTRTADATFDLAPQNYHPRGIADPPPQTQPLVDAAQQNSLSLPAIAAARQTVRDAAVNRLFESADLDQDENQLDAILDLIFANQS